MQLFEEYGDKLFASDNDSGSSNSSALTNFDLLPGSSPAGDSRKMSGRILSCSMMLKI